MKLGAIHRPMPAERLRAGAVLIGGHQPPDSVNFTEGLTFDGSNMLGNDRLGDCVPAAFYQLGRARWKRISGADYRPTTQQVLNTYESWTGYRPAKPESDQGTDVIAALERWATDGLWLRDKFVLDIGHWFATDQSDAQRIKSAVDFGGGALMTVRLRDGDTGSRIWGTFNADTPILGDHEVVCLGYDRTGATIITWDMVVQVSWAGLLARIQSCSVPLSRLCLDTRGLSAAGQGWEEIERTLASVLPGTLSEMQG